MALKAVLDSLDSVSEENRSNYIKKDEKYHLDVTPVEGFTLENTSGLRKALEKERSSSTKAREQLKAFEGIDPSVARTAIDALESSDGGDLDTKVEARVKAREKQLLDLHSAEVVELKSANTSLEKQLSAEMITSVATKALSDAGGSVELLLPHVKSQSRVSNRDGRYVVEILNDAGEARISGSGEDMTLTELVKELSENDNFKPAFKASGSSGGGAGGRERAEGSSALTDKKLENMPAQERLLHIRNLESTS